MKKKLASLIEAKVEFPTDLKYKLFDRWCHELCEATGDMSQGRLTKILDMVTPWPSDSDDDAGFDALLPRPGTMEGSARQKGQVFCSVIVDK
eukprot:3458841-Heterocapsa_arctica.AAC.1